MLPCIGHAVTDNWQPKSDTICFDFSNLAHGFVKPTGVTVFSNLINWLQVRGCKIRFSNYHLGGEALKYLDDSLFFEKYFETKLSPYSNCRSTTIPLMEVKLEDYHQWINSTVISWLNRRLAIDVERQMPEFRICFDEIFNNIRDHSGVDIGCAFAQHYPNIDKVEISISDFGVGIPTHIRRIQPQIAAHDALVLAAKEGISTKSIPSNRGSGLDTLIQNIVVHNKGEVTIFSHDGRLTCSNLNGEIRYIPAPLPHLYPGTLLKLKLCTNTIPEAPYTPEVFTWDF